MEAMVLVGEAVVAFHDVALERVPNADLGGSEAEGMFGEADILGCAWSQVAGPLETSADRGVRVLSRKLVEDFGGSDSLTATVGHTELNGTRLVILNQVVARLDNLRKREVFSRTLLIDEKKEVQHVSGLSVDGGCGITQVWCGRDTHAHVALRGIGGNCDFLCKDSVVI